MEGQQFNSPYLKILTQDNFNRNEVGITHPDTPAHIRLLNTGDVEISAGEGLCIYMSPSTRSITFMADSVKVITKDDGFRWNKFHFNQEAWQYNQPTFRHANEDISEKSLYRGVDIFTGDQ